jgi:SAM-dependent methyltransferase
MSRPAESLIPRFFPPESHPYRKIERAVRRRIAPDLCLLDAGCGRYAERLIRVRPGAGRAVGVDLVEFTPEALSTPGLELHRADLARLPLPDASVDLIYSVSVMEHLKDPAAVYREVHRVLKPGGLFLFLTPNLWDYGSLAARIIPNRLHPWIVRKTEGRAEADTFPTHFRSNTTGAVRRLAREAGLDVELLEYQGQYPSYLLFSRVLFLLGTAYQKTIETIPGLGWLQGWLYAELRRPAAAGTASSTIEKAPEAGVTQG